MILGSACPRSPWRGWQFVVMTTLFHFLLPTPLCIAVHKRSFLFMLCPSRGSTPPNSAIRTRSCSYPKLSGESLLCMGIRDTLYVWVNMTTSLDSCSLKENPTIENIWAMYTQRSVAADSASSDSTNYRSKLFFKKFQKFPKIKTWACHVLVTIYTVFTLYLQVFTQYLHCIGCEK